MKDVLYYEHQWRKRLFEFMAPNKLNEIMRTEMAEIYRIWKHDEYCLFIHKSRKTFQICGNMIEKLKINDEDSLFENSKKLNNVIDIRLYYKVYQEYDNWNECQKWYDETLMRCLNVLQSHNRTQNKRQKRKTDKDRMRALSQLSNKKASIPGIHCKEGTSGILQERTGSSIPDTDIF